MDRPIVARLVNVSKRFDDGPTVVTALDRINLDVRYGEMLFIVGPSGCGKTTLLSVLSGVLDATEGYVELMGSRFDAMTQSAKTDFRRDNIGFVFQQNNLIPTLTATENVAVPLLLARQRYSSALARARQMLKRVDLEDRADFLPGKLSGGQQQRVAIARALVSEPKLVVCDEPTASLDSQTGQVVMDLLRSVALDMSRAIVVVTHDSHILPFGDRLATMHDARIQSVSECSSMRPSVPKVEAGL